MSPRALHIGRAGAEAQGEGTQARVAIGRGDGEIVGRPHAHCSGLAGLGGRPR